MTVEHVSVNDGKYTVVLEDGNLHAMRYGEPWGRSLAGDNSAPKGCSCLYGSNLVYWLAVDLAEARAKIESLQDKLNDTSTDSGYYE